MRPKLKATSSGKSTRQAAGQLTEGSTGVDLNSKYDACNPWPQDEQQKILFLLDTHNKFERELLSGWIQRHRNATSAEGARRSTWTCATNSAPWTAHRCSPRWRCRPIPSSFPCA
ncbi:MAG: hypothetical protein IPG06_20900 [Haliea sp.]|nr:hypothetical protein [Haliea sp.]